MLKFTDEESLTQMNKDIKKEAKDIEYWGQLNISRDDLDILCGRIKTCLDNGFNLKGLFRQYPYAMVSYVVFLAKYQYNGDFWGMISDEIGIDKPNGQDQSQIGKIIFATFDACKLDYSSALDSVRKYVDSVLLEIGEPPESNLGDLFYIFKYGFMSNIEPQLLIDEITSRAYGVHKPLLHFLEDSHEDRAINFILDMQDTYLSATQSEDLSGKYAEAYSNWAEQDKEKASYRNKKDDEHVEVRPYFTFDNGKKGLCIVLPRQNMVEEWVENAKWSIHGDQDFLVEKQCNVQGGEGKRFIDQMIVAVKPCKHYAVSFEYDDGFDKHPTEYELKGIEAGEFFYFNSNGRRINQKYLCSPFGVIIYPETYDIKSQNVSRDFQSYPLLTAAYKIEQISPLDIDSQLTISTDYEDIILQMRPQLSISMEGKKLFDSENVVSEIPLFLEIPELHLLFEGFTTTEGVEIRIGQTALTVEDLEIDLENVIDITNGFEKDSFGIHSIRIYQFGRFIKQERFCLLPEFSSNYDSDLIWPGSQKSTGMTRLTIKKVDGWDISFANGSVQDLADKYEVSVPYSEGTLHGTVISRQDNLHVLVDFEVPICAFKSELVSKNDLSEKCDLDDFLNGNPWASISFYGDYVENEYTIELSSVNGVEQKRQVKLSNNGAVNVDLNVFRDTVQTVPLPVKIAVHNEETDEEFNLVVIDEVVKFKKRPSYAGNANVVGIWAEDVNSDVQLEKYGDKDFTLTLDYEGSRVNEKGWRVFYLKDDEVLLPGYYRVVRENNANDLLMMEDVFSVSMETDQFFYSSKRKLEPIDSFSIWLEQIIFELLKCKSVKHLEIFKKTDAYISRGGLYQYEGVELSDNDILNLVILGSMLEAKISNAHKNIICDLMILISRFVLSNTDRFRVIEKLVEVKSDEYIFNWCIKNYILMLCDFEKGTTKERVREIARDVKLISAKLSLLMLMKIGVPIRETIGDPVYRDLLGQDAIVEMMQTNVSDELKNEDRKHFLREDGKSKVHIRITEEISGVNKFYEMIDEERSRNGRIYLDKKKIPDNGLYFDGSRYTDLFVNWYIRKHPAGGSLDPEIDKVIRRLFDSFKTKVWIKIFSLGRDEAIGQYVKEYNEVLFRRASGEGNAFSLPNFFYYGALAALLSQLEAPLKISGVKEEANWYLLNEFELAPYMAERDLLMASVFVYLRRKEE